MNPKYYQIRKWSANDDDSTVTKAQLRRLRAEYKILDSVILYVPSKYNLASRPPSGHMTMT